MDFNMSFDDNDPSWTPSSPERTSPSTAIFVDNIIEQYMTADPWEGGLPDPTLYPTPSELNAAPLRTTRAVLDNEFGRDDFSQMGRPAPLSHARAPSTSAPQHLVFPDRLHAGTHSDTIAGYTADGTPNPDYASPPPPPALFRQGSMSAAAAMSNYPMRSSNTGRILSSPFDDFNRHNGAPVFTIAGEELYDARKTEGLIHEAFEVLHDAVMKAKFDRPDQAMAFARAMVPAFSHLKLATAIAAHSSEDQQQHAKPAVKAPWPSHAEATHTRHATSTSSAHPSLSQLGARYTSKVTKPKRPKKATRKERVQSLRRSAFIEDQLEEIISQCMFNEEQKELHSPRKGLEDVDEDAVDWDDQPETEVYTPGTFAFTPPTFDLPVRPGGHGGPPPAA